VRIPSEAANPAAAVVPLFRNPRLFIKYLL
jgi:hypothetical protein